MDKTSSPFDVNVVNVAIDTKQVDSNKTDADLDDNDINSDANDDGVLNADDVKVKEFFLRLRLQYKCEL